MSVLECFAGLGGLAYSTVVGFRLFFELDTIAGLFFVKEALEMLAFRCGFEIIFFDLLSDFLEPAFEFRLVMFELDFLIVEAWLLLLIDLLVCCLEEPDRCLSLW